MQQPQRQDRPQEAFGYPPLTEKAESLANDLANTLDDAAFQYGPAVGVMTHEDGSVTVAISGSPTAMKNARNHLEPRLQTLQEGGEITGYRFGPETPESDRTPLQFTTSPDGRRRISPTCAEPRLGEAARGHDSPPDGMAVVWRPVGAKDKNNPYPDARDPSGRFMCPCNGCAANSSVIMNGPAPK